MSPEQQAAIVRAAIEWVDAQAALMAHKRGPLEPAMDRMDAACEGLIKAVEDSR